MPDAQQLKPQKARIRTPEQLQRKRLRDRQSQRLSRENNRTRLSTIEAQMLELQNQFHTVQNSLELLLRKSTSVDIVARLSSDEFLSPSASPILSENLTEPPNASHIASNPTPISYNTPREEPVAPSLHADSMDSGMGVVPTFHEDTDSDMCLSHCEDRRFPVSSLRLMSNSGICDTHRDRSPSLCATNLCPSNPSPNEEKEGADVGVSLSYDVLARQCLCGVRHSENNKNDCLEYSTFKLLLEAHLGILKDHNAAQQFPRSPPLTSLLLMDSKNDPLFEILDPIMKRMSPPDLADNMAVYFIMYRLLRWRVYPIAATYDDVPPWYQPTNLQRSVPHPICIDFIAWPGLRDKLIREYADIDKVAFSQDVAEAITVSWPNNEPLIVKSPRDNSVMLNTKFEEHIWCYENWKLRRSWVRKQPRFVHCVNLIDEGSNRLP